ncbi:CPBP family intramembrane glutamic endopeptidase [Fontibacillus sp. BL9]|uniref:CPBP family intramembrane glutamic endopeptidase n=1 Tax=Fontibacillus sp. BL9 TaxID=3389971 RepID=UPI00397C74C9
MNQNKTAGHPILFSLMLGIGLTLLVSIASAAATIMELGDRGIMIAQGCAFLVMGVIVTVYMKKRDRTMGIFGFNKLDERNGKATLYYIPLLIIALVQPLMGGFNPELSFLDVVIILVFSLLVGYAEESVFRGIIREKLQFKGTKFYIVFSSLFFGILHMANAFNGTGIIHILLQVINALLIGFILALLIETANNIIPLIVFHFLFDALAQVTSSAILDQEILAVSILNILYLVYGIYLIYILSNRKKVSITL